jgi:hypothetical protein
MYINDLPKSVTHDSKAIIFADDTSVLVTDKDYTKFKQKMNLALMSIDRWFTANQLMLNIIKTNVIKFTLKTTIHVPMDISYKNYVLEEVTSTKFLVIHIDSKKKKKNHIGQISHKLSVACFTIRNLTHTLNTDILRMVYFAYFQPVFQYGIILWGEFGTCTTSI